MKMGDRSEWERSRKGSPPECVYTLLDMTSCVKRTMPTKEIHSCQCKDCQQNPDHPLRAYHQQVNLLMGRLDEQQRRWYAAVEANRLGRGGVSLVSLITGLSRAAINRGRAELAGSLVGRPSNRIRVPGGGRMPAERKYPGIEATLAQMLADETAGDPMSSRKWVRSSTHQLSRQLRDADLPVSHATVHRLLIKMEFSLKGNSKTGKLRGRGTDGTERDEQFRYIAGKRQEFVATGQPIISVDTKKKELVGNFARGGKTWSKEAEEVYEYDFVSLAVARAVPYGIYDPVRDRGYVVVGTSANTPEFAGDAISLWWRNEGCLAYPDAHSLLILADGGGCNGYRSGAWKQQLQRKVCDVHGLSVTVCHYPNGCSKWNPVEHRLFSYISINWAGKPLRTLQEVLGYIRGTRTATGLTVEAVLLEGEYKKAQKVSKKELEELNLERHAVCPNRNYTILPRDQRAATGDGCWPTAGDE
jgi:Rhodopirellula transposase DDE domain